MSKGIIVCLADITGVMAQPWVENGYDAILVDPQHPEGVNELLACGCGYKYAARLGERGCPNCEGDYEATGKVTTVGHVLDHPTTWRVLREAMEYDQIVFVAGFPVCTQLAVSGTSRWAEKREKDPHFQTRAMELVHECRVVGQLSGAPWFFENPVSAISSMYRKPDYTFHPFDFGGYLPEDDWHPLYPEYFPPRDAYGKKNVPVDRQRLHHAAAQAGPDCRGADRWAGPEQGPQHARRQVRSYQEHPQRHAARVCQGCFLG